MDKMCEDTKGCCWMTLLKGSMVGGIVMLLFLGVAHSYFPWHKTNVMMFKSEKSIAAALSKNADVSGMYVFGGKPEYAGKKGKMVAAKPYVFASVYKEGTDDKTRKDSRFETLLFCLFSGALLTMLLKKTSGCGCPVGFSMVLGLLIGSVHYLPFMIWYHFSTSYTLAGMLDDFLVFTLMGWAISRMVLCPGAKGNDKKGMTCH